MFRLGDIVSVVKATERTDGHLATRQGDIVEIISECGKNKYVYCARQPGDDVDILSNSRPALKGWVAIDTLHLLSLESGCENNKNSPQLAQVKRETTRSDGYLATRVSDRIEIQYIAHNSSDGNVDWVFGSLLDAAVCETKGWVAASTLRQDRSELVNIHDRSENQKNRSACVRAAPQPTCPRRPTPRPNDLEQLGGEPLAQTELSPSAAPEKCSPPSDRPCQLFPPPPPPHSWRVVIQLLTLGLRTCDSALVDRCICRI